MEFRDIYTVDREKTGKSKMRGERFGNDEYFFVVHVCIFNSEGKMLIQQRQAKKSSWPNVWDISVGGGALAGETSRMAISREVKEELGIDMDFSNVRPALTVNFEHGFDDFYIVERDIELSQLKLQEDEVKAVKWADKDEIFSMLDSGSFIPFMKSMISLMFEMRGKPDCLNA